MTGSVFIMKGLVKILVFVNLSNLGVDFRAPKSGYRSQKRPVLSPDHTHLICLENPKNKVQKLTLDQFLFHEYQVPHSLFFFKMFLYNSVQQRYGNKSLPQFFKKPLLSKIRQCLGKAGKKQIIFYFGIL